MSKQTKITTQTATKDETEYVLDETQNSTSKARDKIEQGKMQKLGRCAVAYFRHAWVELTIIFLAIFLDLLSKFLVDRFMLLNHRQTVINKFFNLFYVHNKRAAFGSAFGLDKVFGQSGVMVFFIIFTFLALSLFFYFMYIFRHRRKILRYGLAMVIGGAAGNLYDRIVYGYVRDFVEIEYFGYNVPYLGESFAIFNVADSFLTVGMGLLIFYLLFLYMKDERKLAKAKQQSDQDDDKDDSQENSQENSKQNSQQNSQEFLGFYDNEEGGEQAFGTTN